MSRCLPKLLVASFLATTLLVPGAQAQLVPAFTLTSEAVDADVLPGETAVFNLTVGNPAVLHREARMSAALPAGWTSNFSIDPVPVAAGASNATLLRVYVPADAAPGSYAAVVEATDDWNFTRANISVVVRERPAASPTPSTAPPAPDVTLDASTGDGARSGETATGALEITNRDARTVTLSLSIAPSGGWSPEIPAADQNRVLTPGASTSARLHVLVPELEANTTRSFTVSVRASTSDGAVRTYTTLWTVDGIAREGETATQPDAAPSQGTSSVTAPAPRTSGGSRAQPNLDVYVDPLELRIPSGQSATAVVQLHNTGDVPLVVTLAGTPPTSWRPFTFSPDAVVELAAGDRADVPMTVTAPDNIPPGGRADAKVTAVTDSSLVRTASFIIRVEPGPPRDTTETATTEAPSSPDGGFPVEGPSILVVAALAAVGGAAAVVASRPLREAFLWGAAGLYTRLARPDVLGHEDREKLYRLVETQPGIHFHALQRDLAWNTGTLTYHLRVLERHGFVVSRRDGLYRRFYLSGAAPRKEVFENQGPTGLRADVLEAVRNTPGISQSDLALGLGANKQTVNYHVKALERAGTIRVEKRGRDTYLFPGGAVAPPGKAEA